MVHNALVSLEKLNITIQSCPQEVLNELSPVSETRRYTFFFTSTRSITDDAASTILLRHYSCAIVDRNLWYWRRHPINHHRIAIIIFQAEDEDERIRETKIYSSKYVYTRNERSRHKGRRELFLLGSRAWHVRLISYRRVDCIDDCIQCTLSL